MYSVFGDLDEYFVLHPAGGVPEGGSTGSVPEMTLQAFLNTRYPEASMISFGPCD